MRRERHGIAVDVAVVVVNIVVATVGVVVASHNLHNIFIGFSQSFVRSMVMVLLILLCYCWVCYC